jgi:phosphonate C-P lyase system protein PhnG
MNPEPPARSELETREAAFRGVLVELAEPAVREMLAALDGYGVSVIQEPQTGLIMMTALDCFDTPFHLGEILVTTAEAETKATRGHATVMGNAPEKAVLAATVNALVRAEAASALEPLWPLVARHRRAVDARRREEDRLVAATRVSFENMAEE